MSNERSSPERGSQPKKKKFFTIAEKRELLEKFYQIPQPCTQRDAAAILNVSQSTFSRLIGHKFAKKIYEVVSDSEEFDQSDAPRATKRLSLSEKLELLDKYDAVQPCSLKTACNLLNIPQSTMSKVLKAKKKLLENSTIKNNCRVVLTDCRTINLGKESSQVGSTMRKPPERKRHAPRRYEYAYEEEIETSDEEYRRSAESSDSDSSIEMTPPPPHLTPKQRAKLAEYNALQKTNPCNQSVAAKKLGISQPALSIILKAARNNSTSQTHNSVKKKKWVLLEEPPQPVDNDGSSNETPKRHNIRSIQEKIKIFRLFDKMQPCSQNKARNVFNISSSTLSGLIANRESIEEEFQNQVLENCEALKKYDTLKPHQMSRAHLICGVTESRLDEILGNRSFWEEEAAKIEDCQIKPSLATDMERVEKELLTWYQANYDNQVTWVQLMTKAKELSKSFGSSFVPTDPWMSKWKRKVSHLISKPKERQTKTSILNVNEESATLLPALKDYHPDNIFNLDETCLYYRAMPGCTPNKDDWITVLFVCNMSGTEKKKLIVVGKSEGPLFFGITSLPVDYKQSSDGRMTEEILSKFLEEWNSQLRTSKRKIALILDNCSLHLNVADKFDCMNLFFVSDNASSPSQPLNRGVISRTKTLFRQKLSKAIFKLANDRKPVSELVCKITVLDSLYMLAEAWEEVPVKMIVNAFAELVFPNLSQPVTVEDTDEDIERLNQLDEDLMKMGQSDEGRRECLEDELSNEEYMVVHVEGVVDPSDDEINNTTVVVPNSSNTIECETLNSSGLENELRKFLDSPPSFPETSKSTKNNILSESLCNDLGLTNSREKEPPTSAEVHEALGVIKRFLRMNGGTLEDFTDFTQLELKVLSKMKS